MRFNLLSAGKEGSGKTFLSKNIKMVGLVVMAIFIFAVAFVAGQTTGYATYKQSADSKIAELESGLESASEEAETCKSSFNSKSAEYVVCQQDLNSSISEITACSSEKDSIRITSDALNVSLVSCTTEKNDYASKLGNLESGYDTLANNSARGICCGIGDILGGSVRNWDVSNNSIICTGIRSVNCSSGAVS